MLRVFSKCDNISVFGFNLAFIQDKYDDKSRIYKQDIRRIGTHWIAGTQDGRLFIYGYPKNIFQNILVYL